MNSLVVSRLENPFSSNVKKLTSEQKDMLVSFAEYDQQNKIILLIMHPERLLDLCRLLFFQFIKLEEADDGELVARITLPGFYARSVILTERQA